MSIPTPRSFVLSYVGVRISTQEYLPSSQGIYLQIKLPNLPNVGDIVNIKLDPPSNESVPPIVIGIMNSGGQLVYSSSYIDSTSDINLPPYAYVGPYVVGDIASVYTDSRMHNLYLNGVLKNQVVGEATASSYQFLAEYTNSQTPTPITIADVIYYPTGVPGIDGGSFTKLYGEYVYSPNSFTLKPYIAPVYTGPTGPSGPPPQVTQDQITSVASYEYLDGNSFGLYLSFAVPDFMYPDTNGTHDCINIGLNDGTSNKFAFLIETFTVDGSVGRKYTCITPDGTYGPNSYGISNAGVFSIVSDTLFVRFYIEGGLVYTAPYVSAPSGYRLYGFVPNELGIAGIRYTFNGVVYSYTGKIGPQGPTGPQGSTGPRGSTGAIGPTGPIFTPTLLRSLTLIEWNGIIPNDGQPILQTLKSVYPSGNVGVPIRFTSPVPTDNYNTIPSNIIFYVLTCVSNGSLWDMTLSLNSGGSPYIIP